MKRCVSGLKDVPGIVFLILMQTLQCWRTSALTDINTYAEVVYANRPTTTSNRGYQTCRT